MVGRSNQNIEKTNQGVEEDAVRIKNRTLSDDCCNKLFFFFAISFHTMYFFVVECLLFFYATRLMVSKSEEKFVLKMSRHGFIRAMETWSV